ncbi:cupin domain-containing protein [Chloroflexota bacterium]
MKVTRLYTGADGKSHFEDVDVPLHETDEDKRSDSVKATGIIFRETGGDYDLDWHNAPRRQYVIILEGSVEITAGDGTKRQLNAGDIMLAEDTTGHGHISRSVNNQPRKCIFVTLD